MAAQAELGNASGLEENGVQLVLYAVRCIAIGRVGVGLV